MIVKTPIGKLKKQGGVCDFLNKDNVAGLVCAMPFIIGFIAFFIVPMGMSLYYSFTNFNLIRTPRWVGFSNYAGLWGSADFWQSIRITFYYTLTSVPLRLFFALMVALILLKTNKLTGVLRAVYYLPSMLGGSIAVAILWRMMFRADGTINSVISFFSPGFDFPWISDTRTAIWVLVMLAVWQFGSSMLIFLASLKQIPEQLYESASIDGAGSFRRFFMITLPLITPTIFFNVIMQTINGLLMFTQVFVIFGNRGNPMGATRVYALEMYRQAFLFERAGMASAMAWYMLIIIAALTAILFLTKRFWVYEGGL